SDTVVRTFSRNVVIWWRMSMTSERSRGLAGFSPAMISRNLALRRVAAVTTIEISAFAWPRVAGVCHGLADFSCCFQRAAAGGSILARGRGGWLRFRDRTDADGPRHARRSAARRHRSADPPGDGKPAHR